MTVISPISRQELESRFDGPIPRQFDETELTIRRRQRGRAIVLERQGEAAIDAANRAQLEVAEIDDDLLDRDHPQWRRDSLERRRQAAAHRVTVQIADAVEALREAAAIRAALGLPEHPLIAVSRRLQPPAPKVTRAA
jgi:hypothetical protein